MRAKVFLGLAVSLCLAVGVWASGDLDGTTFSVTVGEKGSEAGDPDTLIFEGGQFFSTACEEWAFDWVAYSSSSKVGILRFEATTTSEEEGGIHWVGKVANGRIEGTYVWTKEGQDPIEYWFKGAEAEEDDEETPEDGEAP